MKSKYFPYLILLSAFSVSGSAAYYSIFGLTKLFAGAYIPVLIMATTLEVSKLVIASSLHNYWNILNFAWKLYLIPALLVLMVITSAGIYGFLSNAYQITYNKDLNSFKKIEILELKKQSFINKKNEFTKEKEGLIQNISELRGAISNNNQQNVDRQTGIVIKTTSAQNRKSLESQITTSEKRRDILETNISNSIDSISKYEIDISKIKSSEDISSELGPLKYISKITGYSMDIVVNWFLLLLIGVFDPLAIILMVLALKILGLGRLRMPITEHIADNPPNNLKLPEIEIHPVVNKPDEPILINPQPISDNVLPDIDAESDQIQPKSKISKFIDNNLPEWLSDKLKSITGNDKVSKPPTLTDSQRRNMTSHEIKEFFKTYQ